jgi:hypothetical protein
MTPRYQVAVIQAKVYHVLDDDGEDGIVAPDGDAAIAEAQRAYGEGRVHEVDSYLQDIGAPREIEG